MTSVTVSLTALLVETRLAGPASRIDGIIYQGQSHFDNLREYVLKRVLMPFQREGEDRFEIATAWLEEHWDIFHQRHKVEDGFVDSHGFFHTRESAWSLLPADRQKAAAAEGRSWADSTDLATAGGRVWD